MRKVIYLTIIVALVVAYACKKESENYSIYRPTNPQNFKSKLAGELYAFTAEDSAVERADYYLRIRGKIRTYSSNVISYGYCWSPSNSNPFIGSSNTRDTVFLTPTLPYTGDPELDTMSFITRLPNLTADTEYFIRSYIISGDANNNPIDTGYNPVVARIKTVPAIDEWFEQGGNLRPSGERFDAVAFNIGDTVFFGTGSQGGTFVNAVIQMYDPITGVWSNNFATCQEVEYNTTTGKSGFGFADGIGFGLVFRDNQSQQGVYQKCFYVGIGDYELKDVRDGKSRRLLEYDFNKNATGSGGWTGRAIDLPSTPRSGAVCFVIKERVYIGTGKGDGPLSDWWVFTPADERDNNPVVKANAWRLCVGNLPAEKDGNDYIGRYGAVATSANGRGYFGLGLDAKGNFKKDFWEYKPDENDIRGGTWEKKADFPGEARKNAVIFVIGDQVYVGTGDNIKGNMEVIGGITEGEMFNDFYRFDPFNNIWTQVQDYTANKTDRIGAIRKITRAVGYSIPSKKLGFVGSGIDPAIIDNRAQGDFWKYQPYNINGKK